MANHHSIIPQADLPIGRFRIELRATLQILLPEETFTPRPIDCTTVDVSARGLKLCIENMPGELYLRVIRGIRHARISLNDDRLERPVRLDGQVVWVDYHQPDQDALPCKSYIGFMFEPRENFDFEIYTGLVEECMAEVI